MTPYQTEQLQIIRRVAERGKKIAEDLIYDPDAFDRLEASGRTIQRLNDCFIHIIDEITRTTNEPTPTDPGRTG